MFYKLSSSGMVIFGAVMCVIAGTNDSVEPLVLLGASTGMWVGTIIFAFVCHAALLGNDRPGLFGYTAVAVSGFLYATCVVAICTKHQAQGMILVFFFAVTLVIPLFVTVVHNGKVISHEYDR